MAPVASPEANDAGFMYVSIPAIPEQPMEEVVFPRRITSKQDLPFFRHLRLQFTGAASPIQTGQAQRRQFLGELFDADIVSARNTGEDTPRLNALKDERDRVGNSLKRIEDHQFERVLLLTSFERVVITVPQLATGARGVTLYHGGKTTKSLPLNERAMAFTNACSLPPTAIHGPCFVTHSEEYMERHDERPSWRLCDFTLGDCRTDAPWVRELSRRRERSGAKQEDDQKWFMSLPDDDPELPSGRTEEYTWRQTDDDVEVTFVPKPFRGIQATRRDITVRITSRSLFVRLRGRILLDAELYAAVEPDTRGSYWTFSQESFELQITLVKVGGSSWASLCAARGEGCEGQGGQGFTGVDEAEVAPGGGSGPGDESRGTQPDPELAADPRRTPGATPAMAAPESQCSAPASLKAAPAPAASPRRAPGAAPAKTRCSVRRRRCVRWGTAALALYYLSVLAGWALQRRSVSSFGFHVQV